MATQEMLAIEEWKHERLACAYHNSGQCKYGTLPERCSPIRCFRLEKSERETLTCGQCVSFDKCRLIKVLMYDSKPCVQLELK